MKVDLPEPISDDALRESLSEGGRFFVGVSKLDAALDAIVRIFDGEKIPYALCGAMALNKWGYRRMTRNLDFLVTRGGLERFKLAALGRGYVEKFAGSKAVKDTANGVTVDFLITGDFPGDGKPKAVRFPDPNDAAERREHFALLALPKLVELKLASGMTAPHRLKDLADVLEFVKATKLSEDFANLLDASVREKYRELWNAAQVTDADY